MNEFQEALQAVFDCEHVDCTLINRRSPKHGKALQRRNKRHPAHTHTHEQLELVHEWENKWFRSRGLIL